MHPLQNITTILLDIDGTLIDSNDAHAQAWEEAIRAEGFDIEVGAVRPLIGMGGDKLIPKLTGQSADSQKGKALSERYLSVFKEKYLPSIQPFPSTRELCEYLDEKGYKLVVASSSHESVLPSLLEIAGIQDLLTDATSSGDAENSKPDPDIIQAALRKVGGTASESVLIGDTPYDIEAAQRAGMSAMAFRCGGWSDEDLADAVLIVNDPHNLLEHLKLADSYIGPIGAPETDFAHHRAAED